MTDFEKLRKELEKFGLSKNQAHIYLLLVRHHELRIQEIVKLASIPRSSVYESLKGLFEFGIAEETVHDAYKSIRPYSIGVMRHGLDEEMLKLKRLTSDLDKLEQTLTIEHDEQVPAGTTVRYYKARSGARQLYWNTLKAQDTVYVYSDWGRGRYVGMRYYERFVAETRTRQIQERVLVTPTTATLESIRRYNIPGSPISRTRVQDIRAINPKIMIKGDTLIYNAVYAHVFLKEVEINGFEIESQQFVEAQRSIFEALWEAATPIKELL